MCLTEIFSLAFLEQITEFEDTRKRRRPSEDIDSVYATSKSSPAATSDDEEIDELDWIPNSDRPRTNTGFIAMRPL